MIAVRGSHKGWVCLLSLPLLPLSEAAAQSERCVQPPPGLISWWPGDGDFVDIQDGNSASLHSGVTFDAGKVGQGFEFTGTGGQFIDIPSAPNLELQRFTLDAWVRPDGPGPNNDLFGSGIIKKNLPPPLGNTTVSVDLSWSASQSKFVFDFGNVFAPAFERIFSTNTFAPGQFYHVAGTYDGTTFKLYVNGALEGALALTKTMTYDPSVPWSIGSTSPDYRSAGFPRTFNGLIDEVEIYDRALSGDEIADLFHAGSAGKCQEPPSVLLMVDDDTVDSGSSCSDAEYATGTGCVSIEECAFGGCPNVRHRPIKNDPSKLVNDDRASLPGEKGGCRKILRVNDIASNAGMPAITLVSGELGDEGLFAPAQGAFASLPKGLTGYVRCASEQDEHFLDGLAGAPLSESEIFELEGRRVCAVVHDSDISVLEDDELNAMGSRNGRTAFDVLRVLAHPKGDETLPVLEVDFLPSAEVDDACICENLVNLDGHAYQCVPTSELDPLELEVDSLEGAVLGEPYDQLLVASGGLAPFAWSVRTGSLPDGLSLDPSRGAISGIPTEAGVFDFLIEVRDSATPDQVATKAFSIEVVNLPVAVVFVVPPTRTMVGQAIDPAVQVAVVNTLGDVVTTATNLITIAVSDNPGGGALSGTVSVEAVNGVANFPDLRIDTVSSGYTLGAVASGLIPATSAHFDVSGITSVVVGRMVSPVTNHTATLLQDCRALITGGTTHLASGTNGPVDVGQIFDPDTGKFEPTMDSLHEARNDHRAVLLTDGRVFIAGGASEDPLDSAEIYDPLTDEFTMSADHMRRPRSTLFAAPLPDGRVLVGGGSFGDFSFDETAEIYDPSTDEFTPTGNLRIPRLTWEVVLADGRILVPGGFSRDASGALIALDSVEIFDPATGTFMLTDTMKEPRRNGVSRALLPDGRVLLAGGWNGQTLDSAEIFDPATEKFELTGSLNVARQRGTGYYGPTVVLPNGLVLVAGGTDASGMNIKSIELFDPVTEVFSLAGDLDDVRTGPSVTLLCDGSVLVAGGSRVGNNGEILGTAEILTLQ